MRLSRCLAEVGVDLIDCSSGGLVPHAKIELGPHYQVPLAERIRREGGVMTGAVGLIADAEQAGAIVRDGRADIVLLAREMLRDRYSALHPTKRLRRQAPVPVQYGRAFA